MVCIKLLAFPSLHKHHMRQWGITFQISKFRWRLKWPNQQTNSSDTLWDIHGREESPSRSQNSNDVWSGLANKLILPIYIMSSPIEPQRDSQVQTIDHNSLAMAQWKSKWSIASPLDLHIQHQSTTMIFECALYLNGLGLGALQPCWLLGVFLNLWVSPYDLISLGSLCSCFMHTCCIFNNICLYWSKKKNSNLPQWYFGFSNNMLWEFSQKLMSINGMPL